jgi:hypothetical protein
MNIGISMLNDERGIDIIVVKLIRFICCGALKLWWGQCIVDPCLVHRQRSHHVRMLALGTAQHQFLL